LPWTRRKGGGAYGGEVVGRVLFMIGGIMLSKSTVFFQDVAGEPRKDAAVCLQTSAAASVYIKHSDFAPGVCRVRGKTEGARAGPGL